MAEPIRLNGAAAGDAHIDSEARDMNEAATTRAQGPEERDTERIKQILHSMGVQKYGKPASLRQEEHYCIMQGSQ